MEWSNRKTAKALIGAGSGRVDEASWESFLSEINAAIVEAAALDLPLVVDLAKVVRQAIENSRPLIEQAGHELVVTVSPDAIQVNTGTRTS